jgi:hypothetical protein
MQRAHVPASRVVTDRTRAARLRTSNVKSLY